MTDVLLGYAVGSGKPVRVPIKHLAVTGMTQESGKTTTLEALVARSNATALTFITKRGERSFESGRRVKPYFRDRADWQFVDALFSAVLQEKNKFLRPWIMRICTDTRTLSDVHRKVKAALEKATGFNEGIYTQLDAYLDLIVPEIENADLAERLDLAPGINVMDVQDFSLPMQMLFIQSALDWVNERCRNTIVVIPEAWETIPEGKGSPVKASAIILVRKGAGIGNFIWVDSQDMAGVDKTILRGCTVWLVGVQRESNEIKRNLGNMLGAPKPSVADIMSLERGQFFCCFSKTCVQVYVRPAWMDEATAVAIARGQDVMPAKPPAPPPPPPLFIPMEDDVTKDEAEALRATNDRLTTEVADLKEQLQIAETDKAAAVTAALIKAKDFAVAGILDLRDQVQQTMNSANHLAEVMREGRWALPVAAKVEAPKPQPASSPPASPRLTAPATAAQADPKIAGELGAPALAMLRALARSYPQPLDGRLWAIANGNSPGTAESGPWRTKRRILVDAGMIEAFGGGYRATTAGVNVSGEQPANPGGDVAVWALWRQEIAAFIGDVAMTRLRVLATHRTHRLTNEQWALLAGNAPGTAQSGPWRAVTKQLREWELIGGDKVIGITAKGCALIAELAVPATDTAERLRVARRALLKSSQRHYDVLTAPLTRAELGEKLGLSPGTLQSGPWRAAIKEMIEASLVVDEGGTLRRLEESLA